MRLHPRPCRVRPWPPSARPYVRLHPRPCRPSLAAVAKPYARLRPHPHPHLPVVADPPATPLTVPPSVPGRRLLVHTPGHTRVRIGTRLWSPSLRPHPDHTAVRTWPSSLGHTPDCIHSCSRTSHAPGSLHLSARPVRSSGCSPVRPSGRSSALPSDRPFVVRPSADASVSPHAHSSVRLFVYPHVQPCLHPHPHRPPVHRSAIRQRIRRPARPFAHPVVCLSSRLAVRSSSCPARPCIQVMWLLRAPDSRPFVTELLHLCRFFPKRPDMVRSQAPLIKDLFGQLF